MSESPDPRRWPRQRTPIVLFAVLSAGWVGARIVECVQLPYNFPTGPARVFYVTALVVGVAWVILVALLLLIDCISAVIRRSWRWETAELYDPEVDGPHP